MCAIEETSCIQGLNFGLDGLVDFGPPNHSVGEWRLLTAHNQVWLGRACPVVSSLSFAPLAPIILHPLLGGSASTTTWASSTSCTSGVCHTASLVVSSSSANSVSSGSGGIDAKGNPAQKTIFDCIAEQNILHEGVGRGSLLQEDTVLLVGRQRLCVGRIDAGGLNLGDQALVEEDLADVRSGEVEHRTVGGGGRVEVDQDVDVVCSSGVVARDEGVEEHNTVVVGLLDAAEEGGV